MKSIKIHNKDYFPVVERVKEFRKQHPNGIIKTKVITLTDDSVLLKARLYDSEGKLLSTGHSFEKQSWGKINVQSMVENSETSAVGRAMAFLGIGITEDIASADEMKNTDQSDATYTQVSMIESLLETVHIPDKARAEIEAGYISYSSIRAKKCIAYLKENDANPKLDDQLTQKLK